MQGHRTRIGGYRLQNIRPLGRPTKVTKASTSVLSGNAFEREQVNHRALTIDGVGCLPPPALTAPRVPSASRWAKAVRSIRTVASRLASAAADIEAPQHRTSKGLVHARRSLRVVSRRPVASVQRHQQQPGPTRSNCTNWVSPSRPRSRPRSLEPTPWDRLG